MEKGGSRKMSSFEKGWSIGYFRLFIVASGCPSERRPKKTGSCYGDSAKIQDEPTESYAWSFNVVTQDLGLTSHPKNY